jgi:hypothetical protein
MNDLTQKALTYLNELCVNIAERPVGSKGNIIATRFLKTN